MKLQDAINELRKVNDLRSFGAGVVTSKDEKSMDKSEGYYAWWDKGNLYLTQTDNPNSVASLKAGFPGGIKDVFKFNQEIEGIKRKLNPKAYFNVKDDELEAYLKSDGTSDQRKKYEAVKKFKHLTSSKSGYVWNGLSVIVNKQKSEIQITKESSGDKMRMRAMTDIKKWRQFLSDLMKVDKSITPKWKMKGMPPELGKTVGDFLTDKSIATTDNVRRGAKLFMYHGTSAKRAEIIMKKGLRPGNAPDAYIDLIDGYSEHNVYLSVDPKTAMFYGKRAKKKEDDEGYVIFKVEVPDTSKLVADDGTIGWIDTTVTRGQNVDVPNNKNIKQSQDIAGSLKRMGEVGYRGSIMPKFISLSKRGK
jgi:hypothetical protein